MEPKITLFYLKKSLIFSLVLFSLKQRRRVRVLSIDIRKGKLNWKM